MFWITREHAEVANERVTHFARHIDFPTSSAESRNSRRSRHRHSLWRLFVSTLICCCGATGLKAQPPPESDPLKAVVADGDVIVSRVDKSQIKGKILSPPGQTIPFQLPNKSVKKYSTDEYQIAVWQGVTDAEALWSAAEKKLTSVDLLLERLANVADQEAELTDQIRAEHKLALGYLDRIRSFEDAEEIELLPLAQKASELATQAMLGVKDRKKQPTSLETRIQRASTIRREVVGLRPRIKVIQIELKLRYYAEDELVDACLKADQELESTVQELIKKKQPADAHRYLQQAIRLLQTNAERLRLSKKLTTRSPIVRQVETDLTTLGEVEGKIEQLLQSLTILGPEALDALKNELKICREYQQKLREFQEITTDLRSVMAGFDKVLAEFSTQENPDETMFLARITSQRNQLADTVAALKVAMPDDLAQLALREAALFEKQSQDQVDRLLFRLELPRVATGLQQVSQVKTRAAAAQLIDQLDRGGVRLQDFLDKKRLSVAEDQAECQAALRRMRPELDRLKVRMVELDRDEVRAAFLQQSTRQQESLVRAADVDFQVVKFELEGTKKTVATLATDFESRLKDAPTKPKDVDVLLQDMQASNDEASRALEFLTLRVELAAINDVPSDKPQLTKAIDQLKSLKTQIDERAPQLPKSLATLRTRTDEDIVRLDAIFQRVGAKLRFRDAEQEAVTVVTRVTSALEQRQTASAGADLYLAKTSMATLAEIGKETSSLTRESIFTERATDLAASLSPLGRQLAAARLQERKTAGWIPWLGADDAWLPPTAEHEWLLIESQLSRREFDDAEKALTNFLRQHPADEWRTRVIQKQAELSFQRGREWEQQGQLLPAREAHQRTIESGLDHPIVAAASAAVTNIDEQLYQLQGTQNSWMPMATASSFLTLLGVTLAYAVWKRTPHARLQFAARRLAHARGLRSPARREALLREAAYVLAGFGPNDPRVVSLWSLYSIETQGPRTRVATVRHRPFEPPPLPSPADSLDEALTSEASAETVASQCLAWLKSPEARRRSQRSRNGRAIQWLARNLEPQLADSEETLRWKAQRAAECQMLIPDKFLWPRLFQMRAWFYLGRFTEALAVARDVEPKRLLPADLQEFGRIVASCYIELSQWDAAEQFSTKLLKRKYQLPEAANWLATARAAKVHQQLSSSAGS